MTHKVVPFEEGSSEASDRDRSIRGMLVHVARQFAKDEHSALQLVERLDAALLKAAQEASANSRQMRVGYEAGAQVFIAGEGEQSNG